MSAFKSNIANHKPGSIPYDHRTDLSDSNILGRTSHRSLEGRDLRRRMVKLDGSTMGGGVPNSTSLQDFKGVTDKSAVQVVEEKLRAMNLNANDDNSKMSDEELSGFMALYERYMVGRSTKKEITWNLIEQPSENMLQRYDSLASVQDAEKISLLSKLAVLKLNGGLGTSMGCKGPKSVIEVREDTTFLDLIVQQIENLNKQFPGADVPLLLMNSFNTDAETAKIIQKYQDTQVNITTFQQSRYPRIIKESLEPMPVTHDGYAHRDWYPPGHGDFFQSIYSLGVVDTLLAQGKEYIFVSNVDNLGATVDMKILKNIVDKEVEYCMEVTDKTRADIKGGTIISYGGQVSLLEVAQVPNKYIEEFKSVTKFKVFNTNNIWCSLRAIKRVMTAKQLNLDIIVNNKEVDGQKVIQLETAIGAAISYFNNACGVNVPRSRFLPVKSTSDLMLIQSNLYSLKSGSLVMNPRRQFASTPVIKLGTEFKKVNHYLERFGSIPDVLELDHLTISGDVSMGASCVLKGTVIIVANPGNVIMIPAGSVLENKVVVGSLHVIPH